MASAGGFFAGIAITFFGALLIIGFGATVASFAETAGIVIMFGVGILQLGYVIPIYMRGKKTNNEGLRIGLVIGAGLIFLVSAGCGALLLSLKSTDFR